MKPFIEKYLKEPINIGKRNNALFTAACCALELGDEQLLERVAAKAISDGLSPSEVARTIKSARNHVGEAKEPDINGFVKTRAKAGKITVTEGLRKDHHLTVEELKAFIEKSPQGDWYICVNNTSGGRTDKDVVSFDYALVESDNEPIERQLLLFGQLKPCVAWCTHSGGKSIHIVVRVGAKSREEYDEQVRQLYQHCDNLGYTIDTTCKNPARLTRLPEAVRTETGKAQTLIHANPDAVTFSQMLSGYRGVNLLVQEIGDLDPPEAIVRIEGILNHGERLLIAGPPKIGKTLATYILSAVLRVGGRWFDHVVNKYMDPERQDVLYINAETTQQNTKKAAERLLDCNIDMTRVKMAFVNGLGLTWTQITKFIDEELENGNYNTVIIDPLYTLIMGMESDPGVVAQLLTTLDQIRQKHDVTMVVTHHLRKFGSNDESGVYDRISGSGFLVRWADSIVVLNVPRKKKGDPDIPGITELHVQCRSFISPEMTLWRMVYPVFVPLTQKREMVKVESNEDIYIERIEQKRKNNSVFELGEDDGGDLYSEPGGDVF